MDECTFLNIFTYLDIHSVLSMSEHPATLLFLSWLICILSGFLRSRRDKAKQKKSKKKKDNSDNQSNKEEKSDL